MERKKGFQSIDAYIESFPADTRERLQAMRTAIRQAAPGAEERISYQMPAFYLNGNLVYFAAYEKHIGFYPTSSGISRFRKELAKYKSAKGSVQFPLAEPLPLGLIQRIVKFRIEENLQKKARR
jgi:uncharacterized protein YdhG (YjbR/CyaY superfamily)